MTQLASRFLQFIFESQQLKMAAAEQKSSDTFCIGTWNVHNWYDGNGKPNFSRIQKSINSTPIDIIGLQECCRQAQGVPLLSGHNHYYPIKNAVNTLKCSL